MKKNYLFILAVAMFAASCIGNPVEPEQTAGKKTNIIIHATEEATRAIHGTEADSGTSFTWQSGIDKLALFVNDNDYLMPGEFGYRFVNTTDGVKATFISSPDQYMEDPVLAEGSELYGFYPYGTAKLDYVSVNDVSTPVLRNSLGALLQSGSDNTEHLFRGDYMLTKAYTVTASDLDAEGNAELHLQFRHIFAKMRFNIKNNTSSALDIHSLIYRSTLDGDTMQGTLYLNPLTGEFVTPDYYNWGDIKPSSSAVLEVKDVTLAPGEEANLWMWLMPLDFSAGNEAGRKADVLINTSAGVFRVQDLVFNQPFEPGCVYRQGMDLTDAKLLEDYAYIPDPNFVLLLSSGNEYYDEVEETWKQSGIVPLYDLSLNPLESSGEFYFGENPFVTGCYIKCSEAEAVEHLSIDGYSSNMLSLEGLQYFTGLKGLSINLGMDMSSVMTLRALKFTTLTELEDLYIMQSQLHSIDLSKNTKIRRLELGTQPNLEEVPGLANLKELEYFNINQAAEGAKIDLSGISALKYVGIRSSYPFGFLGLSGLDLETLYISIPSMDGVTSDGTSCKDLENASGFAFPSALSGVERLSLYLSGDEDYSSTPAMVSQFASMDKLRFLDINNGSNIEPAFTAAQASIDTLYLSSSNAAASGWENLSGADTLSISAGSVSFAGLDLSGMTSLRGADISASELGGFSVPASLKYLSLRIQSGVSFTPSNIIKMDVHSPGDVKLGDSSTLVELRVEDTKADANTLSLGSYPALEQLRIYQSVTTWYNFSSIKYASVYPSLKTLSLDGRNVHTVPGPSVCPALENLYVSAATSNMVVNGVASIDFRGYNHLNIFRIGNLNESSSAYKNYNNRYYNGGVYVRSTGAFKISEEQWEAAKAGTLVMTGIDSVAYEVEGVPVTKYNVNSVYSVWKSDTEELTIKDDDSSDGVIVSVVRSAGT